MYYLFLLSIYHKHLLIFNNNNHINYFCQLWRTLSFFYYILRLFKCISIFSVVFWGRGRESLMIKGVDEVLIKETAPDWTPPKDKSNPLYFYFHYQIYDTSYKRKFKRFSWEMEPAWRPSTERDNSSSFFMFWVFLKCFHSFSFVFICPHKNDCQLKVSEFIYKATKVFLILLFNTCKVVINRCDLAKCWIQSCLRLNHEQIL